MLRMCAMKADIGVDGDSCTSLSAASTIQATISVGAMPCTQSVTVFAE